VSKVLGWQPAGSFEIDALLIGRKDGPAKAGNYARDHGPADHLRQGYGGPPKRFAKVEAGRYEQARHQDHAESEPD